MKLRPLTGFPCFLALIIVLSSGMNASPTWAGSLRITMTDSTSVDVPYYWEEGGEVKFEVPGGVAGIPKDQVKSIQEIIVAKEFDPEAIAEASEKAPAFDQKRVMRDLIASKTPLKPSSEKLSADEGLRLLKEGNAGGKKSSSSKDRTFGPTFSIEGDFSELVRADGNNVMVVMRNILSSRKDLKNQNFAMTFYDAEGTVLEQKPCELRQIDVDRKTLRKMGIQGHLYSVTASVKPDAKIRRYEITALTR